MASRNRRISRVLTAEGAGAEGEIAAEKEDKTGSSFADAGPLRVGQRPTST